MLWIHMVTCHMIKMGRQASEEPGHVFPKIQPNTICLIDLTSDRNQAKTQLGSDLSTK